MRAEVDGRIAPVRGILVGNSSNLANFDKVEDKVTDQVSHLSVKMGVAAPLPFRLTAAGETRQISTWFVLVRSEF